MQCLGCLAKKQVHHEALHNFRPLVPPVSYMDFSTVGLPPSSRPQTDCVPPSPDPLPTISHQFQSIPFLVHLRKITGISISGLLSQMFQLQTLYRPLKKDRNSLLGEDFHWLVKDKDIPLFLVNPTLAVNTLR